MWTIQGTSIDPALLGSIEPERILLEYDGPRLFTTCNAAGQSMLAYACGEDDGAVRYLLVPMSAGTMRSLEEGTTTIRTALMQPWAWIVEIAVGGAMAAWSIDVETMPENALPHPSLPLYPKHMEFLRVRMIGDDLRAGAVPASVVVRAVNGAIYALKNLIQYVEDNTAAATRPHEWVRALYNLPVHRFSYRSFEVAFSSPPQAALPATPGHDVLDRAGEALCKALDWANAPDERAVRREDAGDRAMIAALEQLVPPKQGIVREVEIAGRILGAKFAGVRLTRSATDRVRRAANALDRDLRPEKLTGKVREFDKDKLSFTLRWGDGTSPDTSKRCEFPESLYDMVSDAFATDDTWYVLGYGPPGGKPFQVVNLGPFDDEPGLNEGAGLLTATVEVTTDPGEPEAVGAALISGLPAGTVTKPS